MDGLKYCNYGVVVSIANKGNIIFGSEVPGVKNSLFRKSGNLNRQQALKDQLNAGKDITSGSEDNLFNAHDVANLLKTYLTELPEPILQER